MNGWLKGVLVGAHGILLAAAIIGGVVMARDLSALGATMGGVVRALDEMDARHGKARDKLDNRVRKLETRGWGAR
jgi:hypothetical protein